MLANVDRMVVGEFSAQTGKKVRNRNAIIQHEKYPFMLANVDRMVVGEKAVLECKTTGSHNAKQWENDEVPATYILQVQWYLAVLGEEYQTAYIACLIGGQRFVWKEIKRDDELIEMMINQAKKFWEEHVMKMTPPAIDGSNASNELLNKLYPTSEKDSEIELPNEVDLLIEEYQTCKAMVKEWQEQALFAENQIKEHMGTFETGQATEHVVSWKSVSSNRVDTKALKEKYPEVYKDVMKETSSRRFTIK